ncbi:TrkH family potassium uptake protein [Fusobacterium canifelinum]|uniref:TrkH family potassium uptake protein n=1 Tax=Fusobacterium canifelinum TaxID=285729 RepID=A0A3P1V4V8_9FUSO|nr:TrkH family potassium uptake protein [Fusobacterium canifelinum]QQB73221.1 TrkH family potassium uptake protein [Fusobacterium canifelinum]RRD28305.1 TrkH family potassium uptake protein [Fusobacterium canifelinum]
MNTRIISYVISNLFKLMMALFLFPLAVSIYYKEGLKLSMAYIIPIIILCVLSYFLSGKSPENQSFFSKEGLVIVALSWLLISFFGALPFVISGEIPNMIDAFFESVSGFTTTGASILPEVESLSKSILFWRSFTHVVGGMGVLVLVLAILPKGNNQALHIMRAEVPGPTVGKIVAKMSYNSRILYIIYISMIIILIIFLLLGGMPLFDACIHAFGTAGTGGFSCKNTSIGFYNSAYIEYVIAVGMIAFGLNFNLFYLLILGNIKQVFKSEEARYYLSIIFIAVMLICINIYPLYSSILKMIRDVFFTVSSIITTTGFSTANFDKWPTFSKTILMFLMFCGGCAGSTAGGFKVSRLTILIKKFVREFKKIGHPNKVLNIKLEGKTLDKGILEGVDSYFVLYSVTLFILLLITAWDSDTFITAVSAVLATFNNIGPGFDAVGPTSNFLSYSPFTKIVLSLGMLLGRLEIIPLLILVSPRIYRKRD